MLLLRLRVRGFKNLEDVTVRFGPLTCLVGLNGVGKSNLFDAIHFLRLLADHPIQEAAAGVRVSNTGSHTPLDLVLDRDPAGEIRLEADFLVPKVVKDDFQRDARASATLLRYEVAFRCRAEPTARLELTHESLGYHKKGEAKDLLGFPASRAFIDENVEVTRRGELFISTQSDAAPAVIKLHQDGGSRGQPFPPGVSPRTVLCGTNTSDYPTVLAARREMQSWRLLQLEPSAMRSPDPDDGRVGVNERGGGVAATLYALKQATLSLDYQGPDPWVAAVNTLRDLNEQVDALRVDRDVARNQLLLQARMRGMSEWLGARSLSEGTLRFLALATLRLDPTATGLIALEEPENGIHPTRVRALVDHLRDLAVDPTEPIGPDNPLRQVILNTHSPDVVRRLYSDEILWVERQETPRGARAQVRPVAGGWRGDDEAVSQGALENYIRGAPLGPTWGQQLQLFGEAD